MSMVVLYFHCCLKMYYFLVSGRFLLLDLKTLYSKFDRSVIRKPYFDDTIFYSVRVDSLKRIYHFLK